MSETDGHAPLLGRYQIEQTIYRSSGSTVYRAFDVRMEREVVVKKIPASKKTKVRAVREARTVARLNHANIVTLFDFQETDEAYYLIMEYVNGLTLKDVLDKIGHFSVDAGLAVILQIAGALEFAHMNDVIHRDVKPENVMILPDGRVKVMDFGVAYLQNTDMTQKGSIVGTIAYMSPEQAKGEPVDERADVFSLGVVAYEVLTGLNPFELETTGATLMKIAQGDPDRPSIYNREISQSLDTYVLKTLSKEPDLRYDFMTDLRYKLERARTTRSPLEKLVKEAVRPIYENTPEEHSNFLAARDDEDIDDEMPADAFTSGRLKWSDEEVFSEDISLSAKWIYRLWPSVGVLSGVYALHQILLGGMPTAALAPTAVAALTVLVSQTLGYIALTVVALAVLIKFSPLWTAVGVLSFALGFIVLRHRSKTPMFTVMAGPLFAYPLCFFYPVVVAGLLRPVPAGLATALGTLFMAFFVLSVEVGFFGLSTDIKRSGSGAFLELWQSRQVLLIPVAAGFSSAILSVIFRKKKETLALGAVFGFYVGMFFIIGSISASLELSGEALAASALVSGILSFLFVRGPAFELASLEPVENDDADQDLSVGP